VTLRLGPFKLSWLGKDSRKNDPYWDFFINTPPADLANTVTDLIRNAPPGNIFPTKADIHTPEITSSHLKEMARYFGADLVGIAKLPSLSPKRRGNSDVSSIDSPLPSAEGRGNSDASSSASPLPSPEGRGHPDAASLAPVLPSPSGRGKGEGLEEYPFAVVCAVRAEYDPRSAHGIGGQVPVQNGLFITFVLSAWIRELGFHATPAQDPDAEKLAETAGLGKLDAAGRLVTRQYGTQVYVADIIRTDLPLAADGIQT
jgi:hypothetical protein